MKLLNARKFNKLTNLQKRVEIAKDVLLRIELKTIVPHHGNFWFNKPKSYEVTPQEYINENSCSVCVKGSLLMSWVGNFNNVTWGCVLEYREELDGERCHYPESLIEIFGKGLLDKLEAAFESESFGWHYDQDICDDYADGFRGRNSLELLMQNIIDNNGELIIPLTPIND